MAARQSAARLSPTLTIAMTARASLLLLAASSPPTLAAAFTSGASNYLADAPRARAADVAMRLNQAIIDLLPAEVRNNAIFAQAAEVNWDAFSACYPSEEAGIAAVTENMAVILPYGADSQSAGFYELGQAVDRSKKIAGSFEVLRAKPDNDEAAVLEVITKNPGVLGCTPEQLDKASAEEIRRTAGFASGVSSALKGARTFLQGTDWWDEGAAKAREGGGAKSEDKPMSFNPFGFGGGDAAEEEEAELELPTITVEGEEYMYDLKGEFNGIEHVMLNMEGVPVGVWNPESFEFEEVEFVDEAED